jgi:hypothetical protein
MPTRRSYVELLETNMLVRQASDVNWWLCHYRTVQESALFPVPAYMMLSYLNAYYRYPELLRKIDAAMPAEEIGDRARETCTTLMSTPVGWCLHNFYLLGREYLMDLGLVRATDAVDDLVFVVDFWKRFMLAYHRSDGHLTTGSFGNRSQAFSERQLQVFESDAIATEPGDRLQTAVAQFMATASQYALLVHCESRPGIQNEGPYRVGDNEMMLRFFLNLAEGDYPWLDGVATSVPYGNLVIPVVMRDTHFTLLDDWSMFECEPPYDPANVAAVGLYTSDYLSEGFIPVGMGSADELAATFEDLREVLRAATADLWKVIAGWSRDQMLDAGALTYYAIVRDLAHIAGVYEQDDWFALDERVQRFKPLMNDEYARDALGEMLGYLSYSHQASHEYTMARYSEGTCHMESPIPLSVLADDEFTATSGPIQPGWSSLPPKTALWTTTQGRLTQDEVNKLARDFRPQVLTEPYRFLDDEWVKTHWTDPRADDLYRLSQQHSRTLAGRGAGLRRADLPSVKG